MIRGCGMGSLLSLKFWRCHPLGAVIHGVLSSFGAVILSAAKDLLVLGFCIQEPSVSSAARPSSSFLLVQERRNQKEGHPGPCAFRASCPPGSRLHYGPFRQYIRVLAKRWPTSCRPPFGLFLRAAAATQGPQQRPASCPQKKCRNSSQGCSVLNLLDATASATEHPVLFPGFGISYPLGTPQCSKNHYHSEKSEVEVVSRFGLTELSGIAGRMHAAVQGPCVAARGDGSARRVIDRMSIIVSPVHGRTVETARRHARTRRAGCPESATTGCRFFWLLFFGQAKKSDTRVSAECCASRNKKTGSSRSFAALRMTGATRSG